jgi:hypothetical protein
MLRNRLSHNRIGAPFRHWEGSGDPSRLAIAV